jgi:hypothetical protein
MFGLLLPLRSEDATRRPTRPEAELGHSICGRELVPGPATTAVGEVQVGTVTDLRNGLYLAWPNAESVDALVQPARPLGRRKPGPVTDTEGTLDLAYSYLQRCLTPELSRAAKRRRLGRIVRLHLHS